MLEDYEPLHQGPTRKLTEMFSLMAEELRRGVE